LIEPTVCSRQLSGEGISSIYLCWLQDDGLIWLTEAVICLLAAPRAKFSTITGSRL